MKKLLIAIITILIICGGLYYFFAPRPAEASYYQPPNECNNCSVVYSWTIEGIPHDYELIDVYHAIIPLLPEIDCMTIENAEEDRVVLSNLMDFIQFDYADFASSICETTTLTFYNCDNGTNNVPIPASGLLLFSGFLGFVFIRRKKNV
jgi:hypothetical protein